MKPGIQTTEFWLSTLTTIVSLLAAFGIGLKVNDQTLQSLAAILAFVVPAVYTLCRTALKLKPDPLPPLTPGV
jgi:hypothetical protein